MGIAFPKVRVGAPARCSGLTVFPLFTEGICGADYVLGSEAVEKGLVTVEEVGSSGSVPDLAVVNDSDFRVLFLEGDQLIGAKQNRVLNATLLVPAKSRTLVPVSCVERGRWRFTSRTFGFAAHSSPHHLRHLLRASVSRSLRESRSLRSDQGAVWGEIARMQDSLGTVSHTEAMADTYAAHQEHLNECRENLRYADGAAGFAVGIGGRLTSFDLFDRPRTCRKVWDRVLSGAVLSALEVVEDAEPPSAADVERMLADAAAFAWEDYESAGEGRQYRSAAPSGEQGAALVLDDVLVHGSVVARC